MKGVNLQADFAGRLARLSGAAFQDAVCAQLCRHLHHFQAIPMKPHGDGGIDGASDRFEVVYCCYGLELDAVRMLKNAEIKNDIVDKFKSDLRRILELEQNKKAFVKRPNDALKELLPAETKIKHIKCICNWFEHAGIIKALNDAFAKYIAESDLTYVDATCTLTVHGPKEFAASVTVDEMTLLRLELPNLTKILSEPPAAASAPPTTTKFDQKFALLLAAFPDQTEQIDALKASFLSEWAGVIGRLTQIENQLPQIYDKINRTIRSVATDAALASTSLAASDATTFLSTFTEKVTQRLTTELAEIFPPDLARPFAEQVVAKLIGECPISWRHDAKPN